MDKNEKPETSYKETNNLLSWVIPREALEYKPKHPTDKNALVWRYLDLPEFIWLLDNRKLYLPSLSKLPDKHEGSIHPKVMENLKQGYRDIGRLDALENRNLVALRLRDCTYVSCWCLDDGESDAMWRIYNNSNEGIAIVTTYAKLEDFAERNGAIIGLVEYEDYAQNSPPPKGSRSDFMRKRKAFSYENEVRLVVRKFEYIVTKEAWEEIKHDRKTLSVREATQKSNEGLRKLVIPCEFQLDFDIEKIIEKIYVNPYAKEWYYTIVKSIVDKYSKEFSNRVYQSSLKEEPVF